MRQSLGSLKEFLEDCLIFIFLIFVIENCFYIFALLKFYYSCNNYETCLV